MRPMRLVGGSLIVLILAACTAPPVPSSPPPLTAAAPASARPSPATPPPPVLTPVPATATPEPSIPADLSTTAVVEHDGVRLRIELERNPMPAGEVTWVHKTITNTGPDPLVYYPCGEAMSFGARIADLPWRPGQNLPNPLMAWKGYLIDNQGIRTGDRDVIFLPPGLDGSSSGCGDVGHIETLAPGASMRERSRWDGFLFRHLAPPPTARVDLIGRFSFDRGDPAAEHPPEDRNSVEVQLETWIAGLPDAFLDPGEAVDVALTEPRLIALLASRELRNGNEGVLIFDPKTGAYQIGMLESGSLPVTRVHLVLLDARTGEIEGWVERDWDYGVDGYP